MSRQKRNKKATPPPKRTEPRFPRLKKALGRFFTAILALMLAVVFYVAVVMGQPSAQVMESAAPSAETQPSLPAQPAYQTQSAASLVELLGQFPAPALTFSDSASMAFVSGRAYDQAYEGGFARILEMIYLTPMGQQVTLQSIYPARAFELLGKDDFTLNELAQGVLGGQNAVLMTSADQMRLHAQGEEAIYALTVPAMSHQELGEMTRHTLLTHPS
ncbi:MAG: hypothetical protein IJF65_05810 [Clostridia bacterium]|nr:hypothetical protein [Clostridia bacterium]